MENTGKMSRTLAPDAIGYLGNTLVGNHVQMTCCIDVVIRVASGRVGIHTNDIYRLSDNILNLIGSGLCNM